MTPFNHFVTVQLTPEMLASRTDSLSGYLSRVREEKMRITGELLELSSSPAGENCEAMIWQWQNMCVELLETLRRFRASISSPGDIDTFYASLEGMLHALLVALEQHFGEYLLPDLAVPHSYAVQARRQLRARLQSAERELRRNALHHELLEIISSTVKRFTDDADARICFRELSYYRELLNGLLITVSLGSVSAEHFNLQIHFLLIHLDFNAEEYFLYCACRVRKWLRILNDMDDRVIALTWCLRQVRNIPLLREGSVCFVKGFPVKHQLAAWLEEERIFIRVLIEMGQKPAARPDDETARFCFAFLRAAIKAGAPKG